MINLNEAVRIAKTNAAEILGAGSSNLEEIERDTYKDREVWSITLSVPQNLDALPSVARLAADPIEYKRFLIDVGTGELVATRLRELASRCHH